MPSYSLKEYLIACMGLIMLSCESNNTAVAQQADTSEISSLFSQGRVAGVITSNQLNEASGLTQSRSNPNFLWSHNDSGGKPILYLMNTAGINRAEFYLSGAENFDWEDMAIGVGPNERLQYLYVGDIGDNQAVRKKLTIYRLAEPDLSQIADFGQEEELDQMLIESIDFVYEDGPRDAETLLVDPYTARKMKDLRWS